MAGYRAPITSFSKGVFSRKLLQRVDVEAYSSGLLRGENIIVLREGGFSIRPGFRFVDETLDDGEVLFPFSFSNEQTYALAMGQGYMQPLAYGGFLLEDEFAIVGATNTNPLTLTVTLHGYDVGDRLFIPVETIESGMLQLNGRALTVSRVIDDNTLEFDVDATGWGAFTASVGGVTNTVPPPSPPPSPPVPPPVPPPAPPDVGGDGGGGDNPTLCVAEDTPILLANGTEQIAWLVHKGALVRTRHEKTLEWGDHRVKAISFTDNQPVFRIEVAGRVLRATARHRVWIDERWQRMEDIGVPDGLAKVAKITVEDAATYVSAGILSHNRKMDFPF